VGSTSSRFLPGFRRRSAAAVRRRRVRAVGGGGCSVAPDGHPRRDGRGPDVAAARL